MDLFSASETKSLLAKYNAKPSKGLGQNFLIDKNILAKIIEASNIKKDDVVLEVGPGVGTLTCALAEKAKQVIAVEKDQTMIKILSETLADYKNTEIINADILHYKLQTTNYKLVANIPYYLTSPLIRKFLESENPPKEMVLMLQKEVAQRITGKPPKMSLLAVSVQFYADAKIISYVSKNCFYPAPKVDSAIIKITPKIVGHRESYNFSDLFFKIVKAGFSQPRKQLAGNLSKTLKMEKGEVEQWLKKSGINPSQRAETLSVDNWKKLVDNFVYLEISK